MNIADFIKSYIKKRNLNLPFDRNKVSVRIPCPNPEHKENTPSCFILLKKKGQYPVGSFKCFGCSAKGGFGKFLYLAGYTKKYKKKFDFIDEEVDFDLPNIIDTIPEYEEIYNQSISINFKKWRGFDTSILKKLGAKLYFDDRSEEQMLIMPWFLNKQLIGATKYILEKDLHSDKKQLSYVECKGSPKNKYMFPYDYVAKMGKKSVVLVEGHRDALVLLEQHIPALAILGTQTWATESTAKYKIEMLEALGVNTVFIMMDNDPAGREAKKHVKNALDRYFKVVCCKYDENDPYKYFRKNPDSKWIKIFRRYL